MAVSGRGGRGWLFRLGRGSSCGAARTAIGFGLGFRRGRFFLAFAFAFGRGAGFFLRRRAVALGIAFGVPAAPFQLKRGQRKLALDLAFGGTGVPLWGRVIELLHDFEFPAARQAQVLLNWYCQPPPHEREKIMPAPGPGLRRSRKLLRARARNPEWALTFKLYQKAEKIQSRQGLG